MDYNKTKYLEILAVLQLIEADYEAFSISLSEAFFIDEKDRETILTKMNDPIYYSTNTQERLEFLEKSIQNGASCFGSSHIEQTMITTKKVAIELLSNAFGKYCKNALNEDNGSALSKLIIGMYFYYGIGQELDKETGEIYLQQAMSKKDVIWEYAFLLLLNIDKERAFELFEKREFSLSSMALFKFLKDKYNYNAKETLFKIKNTTIGFN